jgi:catechol 2,3-dioxygenase-like lactoylglutathione lyase family enzyme
LNPQTNHKAEGGTTMKRLHIHIGVENIDEATHFYTTLFGAEPVKTKPDYAKWLLDDPRVNFAISAFRSSRRLN